MGSEVVILIAKWKKLTTIITIAEKAARSLRKEDKQKELDAKLKELSDLKKDRTELRKTLIKAQKKSIEILKLEKAFWAALLKKHHIQDNVTIIEINIEITEVQVVQAEKVGDVVKVKDLKEKIKEAKEKIHDKKQEAKDN